MVNSNIFDIPVRFVIKIKQSWSFNLAYSLGPFYHFLKTKLGLFSKKDWVEQNYGTTNFSFRVSFNFKQTIIVQHLIVPYVLNNLLIKCIDVLKRK